MTLAWSALCKNPGPRPLGIASLAIWAAGGMPGAGCFIFRSWRGGGHFSKLRLDNTESGF